MAAHDQGRATTAITGVVECVECKKMGTDLFVLLFFLSSFFFFFFSVVAQKSGRRR